ncbi:MAG: hypothetical protein CFE24_09815 [Flavobacterium sp. BFFFF2]|nr:MAG: hypothetical protein CFE24_09815 [Flavobacterium sp. BFFFF2]
MEKTILNLTLLLAQFLTFGQAPAISYPSPQDYEVGIAITPLSPVNTGGLLPATVYGQVSTFAGTGIQGANDGQRNVASFKFPNGIGFDTSDNSYVAEQANGKVRKTTRTGVVTTTAGSVASGNTDSVVTGASFANLTKGLYVVETFSEGGKWLCKVV